MKWNAEEAFAGVPEFTFLFTMEQIEMMLGSSGLQDILHRRGVDALQPGEKMRDYLEVIDIGNETEQWRCHVQEFKRFLRRKRIPVYNI